MVFSYYYLQDVSETHTTQNADNKHIPIMFET